MRRRLFTMMWVLSLLMSVTVVVWWARSYFRGDLFARNIDIVEEHDELDREWFVRSNFGRLYIAHNWSQQRYDAPEPGLKSRRSWIHIAHPADRDFTGPAYFPRNLDSPSARYRSRGFDVGTVSIGHFTIYSWWRNDWSNRSIWAVNVPHWLVALMFLILPGIALRRRLKARRRQRLMESRHCPHCGYDLRASGDSCPECGKPVEVAGVESSS